MSGKMDNGGGKKTGAGECEAWEAEGSNIAAFECAARKCTCG